MVRWSVSKPSRGRQAATRSASAAQVPASVAVADGVRRRSARGTSTSRHGAPLARVVRRPGRMPRCHRPAAATGRARPAARRAAASAPDGSPRTAQSAVTSATSTRSMNRIESSQAVRAPARAGLGGDPGGLAVVDEVQVVLDVTLGASAPAPRWTCSGARPVSCWVVIECSQRQPVGAGDRDDPAVGQVDDGEALGEQALLAQRVAVVGRDARVGAVGRHGAGSRQQAGWARSAGLSRASTAGRTLHTSVDRHVCDVSHKA